MQRLISKADSGEQAEEFSLAAAVHQNVLGRLIREVPSVQVRKAIDQSQIEAKHGSLLTKRPQQQHKPTSRPMQARTSLNINPKNREARTNSQDAHRTR